MPYIESIAREQRNHLLDSLGVGVPGILNYCITRLCHNYLQTIGGISYNKINDVVGALECAKMELYRQIAAPYEDVKKSMNGAVSDLDSKGLEDVRQ